MGRLPSNHFCFAKVTYFLDLQTCCLYFSSLQTGEGAEGGDEGEGKLLDCEAAKPVVWTGHQSDQRQQGCASSEWLDVCTEIHQGASPHKQLEV